MTEFKTSKGTILPLINLKGKPYIQVAHRIVWMREEHPDWSIETESVERTDKFSIFKATIKDATGRILATAHKREDAAHFPDFIEKSETSAIGRAVGLCGFGTQFCESDFDEMPRVVDSPTYPKRVEAKTGFLKYNIEPEPKPLITPVEPAQITIPMTAESAGAHIISFGLHNGKLVSALTLEEATIYCGKVRAAIDSGAKIQTSARRDYDAVKTYFGI